MNFLDELYSGNMHPAELNPRCNPEYKKAVHNFESLYNKFVKEMPREKLDSLDEFLEANTYTACIAEEESFKAGFSLGVQMMHDCLNTAPKCIKNKVE